MPLVRYRGDNLEVEVPVGTSILEASRKAGAHEGFACGGGITAASVDLECGELHVGDAERRLAGIGRSEGDVVPAVRIQVPRTGDSVTK